MSFLKKLLALLGGRNTAQDASAYPSSTEPQPAQDPNSFIVSWQQAMFKRAKEVEPKVRDWIIHTLKADGAIPFTWESGNDEAFVELTSFDAESPELEETIWSMQEYIIYTLAIPDAGEFQMDGNGEIYLQGNEARIRYESTYVEIVDYDEELDEPVYEKVEEKDSGDKLLFTI
jgi:hypothetical protein